MLLLTLNNGATSLCCLVLLGFFFISFLTRFFNYLVKKLRLEINERDERHLFNDIAGILVFGVVGMATYYLATSSLDFRFLLHPTLFFIATTFYVKSMVRERKNPLYLELNILSHMLLAVIYLILGKDILFTFYLFALARSILVPYLGWNVKQVGMFEFITLTLFLIALCFS